MLVVSLLSAFFGADNVPPGGGLAGCALPAGRYDGMPLVFGLEIDVATLSPSDFVVTLANGANVSPVCATLSPASESNENRTVLLAGQFGDALTNPPVSVAVVSDLWSEVFPRAVNYRGWTQDVTPLRAGPTLEFAEVSRRDELELQSGSATLGVGCPASTAQAVRVTWAGGVTKDGRNEITDAQRIRYSVTVETPNGVRQTFVPFAIGDLYDGDNNQDLCLDVPGTPVRVEVRASTVTDPIGDPNPWTWISVRQAE